MFAVFISAKPELPPHPLPQFRPDYKRLGVLRQQLPGVPILALTATATAAVAAEVGDALRLEGAEVFRASVDRPNLFYE